jgi:PPIC-type PPIASE domain
MLGIYLSVLLSSSPPSLTRFKCEKHSKKEEALAKIREGAKFDEVAKEFSEDKARQGILAHSNTLPLDSEVSRAFIITLQHMSFFYMD